MLITKTATFDAAHRLYGYKGLCSNLHGHTYKIEVSWEGEDLDDVGMILDFKEASRRLKEIIVEVWDHSVLLHQDDKKLIDFFVGQGMRVVVFEQNPTAEFMAITAKRKLHCREVKIWETPTSYATL